MMIDLQNMTAAMAAEAVKMMAPRGGIRPLADWPPQLRLELCTALQGFNERIRAEGFSGDWPPWMQRELELAERDVKLAGVLKQRVFVAPGGIIVRTTEQ